MIWIYVSGEVLVGPPENYAHSGLHMCRVSPRVEAYLDDRQREQDRTYRAHLRAKEKAKQDTINDLDDKESVILMFLQNHPGQHSVDDVDRSVKRSRALKGMKPASRRNAIRRLIDPPEGKLPALFAHHRDGGHSEKSWFEDTGRDREK
jgi:hypothetical protein